MGMPEAPLRHHLRGVAQSIDGGRPRATQGYLTTERKAPWAGKTALRSTKGSLHSLAQGQEGDPGPPGVTLGPALAEALTTRVARLPRSSRRVALSTPPTLQPRREACTGDVLRVTPMDAGETTSGRPHRSQQHR